MRVIRRAASIGKRTLVSFYDDQMTQHAGALTYYALMSLFPTALLGLSLLGLVGQYPSTYDAIVGYLRDVAPPDVVSPLDSSLRSALRHKGTAASALALGVILTLYGTTGLLESCRRALNVVFEVEGGRSFLRRKAIDTLSTFVVLALILTSLVLVFVGGGFADDLLGFVGLGSTAARIWSIARWPAAILVAVLVFSYLYYVTPDVQHRGIRWIIPGAVAGVLVWLAASFGFSLYLSTIAQTTALYGAFTAAIVLVVWLWLTSVAVLFGAELNAEIERSKELGEGVPERETLNRPARRG